MDFTIDFSDKEVAGIKSNGTSQQEELNCHNEGVSKVEHAREGFCYLQLGEEVKDGVQEHVES